MAAKKLGIKLKPELWDGWLVGWGRRRRWLDSAPNLTQKRLLALPSGVVGLARKQIMTLRCLLCCSAVNLSRRTVFLPSVFVPLFRLFGICLSHCACDWCCVVLEGMRLQLGWKLLDSRLSGDLRLRFRFREARSNHAVVSYLHAAFSNRFKCLNGNCFLRVVFTCKSEKSRKCWKLICYSDLQCTLMMSAF